MRRIGYRQFGDLGARVVFILHGLPGSRLDANILWRHEGREGRVDASSSGEAPFTFIGVDRPGYGLSDLPPGWVVRDMAADIVALADYLGVERFAILGASAGGPAAAACATFIPSNRLVGVVLVAAIVDFASSRRVSGPFSDAAEEAKVRSCPFLEGGV